MMGVGDKYFFIDDQTVAVTSQPISVGDKVVCMKYNGGLIHPRIPVVEDIVIVIPTPSGKIVVNSIRQLPSGDYYLGSVIDYYIGAGGNAARNSNILGNTMATWTGLGSYGWIRASWDESDFDLSTIDLVTIYEQPSAPDPPLSVTLNPNDYICPNIYHFPAAGTDEYDICFEYPNKILIEVTTAGGGAPWGEIILCRATKY